MNKFGKIFLLLAIAGMLGACSNIFSGEADPLRDQPDDIKKGKAPGTQKVEDPKPVAKDVLLIDASDSYTFREGIEQEITINARCMFDDCFYDLEIANLQDFKGATIDVIPGD
ncbi:hypothetical protein K2X05_08785, partial [bacterium]|nr:hypothetical protein [bacterium]